MLLQRECSRSYLFFDYKSFRSEYPKYFVFTSIIFTHFLSSLYRHSAFRIPKIAIFSFKKYLCWTSVCLDDYAQRYVLDKWAKRAFVHTIRSESFPSRIFSQFYAVSRNRAVENVTYSIFYVRSSNKVSWISGDKVSRTHSREAASCERCWYSSRSWSAHTSWDYVSISSI